MDRSCATPSVIQEEDFHKSLTFTGQWKTRFTFHRYTKNPALNKGEIQLFSLLVIGLLIRCNFLYNQTKKLAPFQFFFPRKQSVPTLACSHLSERALPRTTAPAATPLQAVDPLLLWPLLRCHVKERKERRVRMCEGWSI